MTIAAGYLSSEGVVFGADSTSTVFVQGPGPNPAGADHHYNYAQKIFQIGQQSTLGITMWGLGNLPRTSYRTLIARFSDQLASRNVSTMKEIADLWNQFFWDTYTGEFAPILQRTRQLLDQTVRSPEEEKELNFYRQRLGGGFCLGGNLPHDRAPRAFEILYGPDQAGSSPLQELTVGSTRFWGCPNLIERLIYGVDQDVLTAILQSGRWQGTPNDLVALVTPFGLAQPFDLPIREAIDWVYTSIYTTIQAMKFSHLAPVCGGPVEVAVITSDRPFRWVRHKKLDAALGHGGLSDAS